MRQRTHELQHEHRPYAHDPHTHTHYSPSLFGVSQRGSHCEAFSFRADKALPVRSLLAATSHAAQGGSPASYSIPPPPPPHQPFRLSTAETTPGLWMAIAAGEATRTHTNNLSNLSARTHKHLCICGCRFKTRVLQLSHTQPDPDVHWISTTDPGRGATELIKTPHAV